MLLTHYEPYTLFNRFDNEFSRLFPDARADKTAAAASAWVPAVDIREEQDSYILVADIPGVDRKDVDITLEDSVLTVRGERVAESEESREGYRRKERVQGAFVRQFTLPDTADTAKISAAARDGVLEIRIPKQAKLQPRRIAVS